MADRYEWPLLSLSLSLASTRMDPKKEKKRKRNWNWMARSAVRLIRRFIAPRIINDFPLSSHFLFDRKFARATMQVLSKREIVGTGSVYVSRVLRF